MIGTRYHQPFLAAMAKPVIKLLKSQVMVPPEFFDISHAHYTSVRFLQTEVVLFSLNTSSFI